MTLTAEDYARSKLGAFIRFLWPLFKIAHHHKLILNILQDLESRRRKRVIISMPPRHGKSLITSEYYPAWYIGRNPDHSIIHACHTQELADDFGRKVRNSVQSEYFKRIFTNVRCSLDSSSKRRFNMVGHRGAYFATGITGPVTGRGANLLIIDDPIKTMEQAESRTQRDKMSEWFNSVAYTRLAPDGVIVVIQCMTGDTPVLMADGTERRLDALRVGDAVATFDNGVLAKTSVQGVRSNGRDCLFTITTSSGKVVRANGRHPFLIEEKGWVQTKNLRPTMKIVALHTTDFGVESIVSVVEGGVDEVFDVQIERTENFIANGLVSHNTRWHQGDLSGYILENSPEKWDYLTLPAVCENEDDALGREIGAPLWPEAFPTATLEMIKNSVGSRVWTSLYQQRPAPETGGIIKPMWFGRYKEQPFRFDRIIQSWDTAKKVSELHDFSVCCTFGEYDGKLYLLDILRQRVEFPQLVRFAQSSAAKWRPHAILIEDAASGTSLIQALRYETSLPVLPIVAKLDKTIRAQAAAPTVESGRVYVPEVAPWLVDFETELMAFPNANFDDQVDAFCQYINWWRDHETSTLASTGRRHF